MTRGIPSQYAGKRFGALVAVSRNGSDAQNNALWTCKCDCGNVVDVRASMLLRGQRFCCKQCPQYQTHARIDIRGKRFKKLVAMRPISMADGSGKAIWEFVCDCGQFLESVADNVMTGNTSSCGCIGIASRIKHGRSQTLEYHREAHRKWAKANPHLAILNAQKRREDFRRRIPPWLTQEHWDQIKAFYVEAARLTTETGIPHVVDHIHPLRGKTVSGLHVPWNLQVITQDANLRKSARFTDDVC